MKDRRLFSITGFSYMLINGLSVLAATLLYVLMARVFPLTLNNELTTWIIGVVPTYVFTLIIGLPLMRLLEKKTLYKSGMSPGGFFKAFCIIIFLTYAGSVISTWVNNLLSGTTGFSVDTAVTELVTKSSLGLVFLFSVILAPVMEELIFRKLLIDRMIVFGDGVAIMLSAVIFGVIHGNISQCVYGFLVGWLLGYVYVRTGRILYTMLLHMLMNFMGSVAPLWVEQTFGTQSPGYWMYLVLVVVLFLLGVLFFILAIVKRRITLLPGERTKGRVRMLLTALSGPGIWSFIIVAAIVFVLNASLA